MRCDLSTAPKVVHLSSLLSQDRFAIVGRLHTLWSWADQHSVDGNAMTVTESFIDELVNSPGFACALRKVGWLEGRENLLSLPRFAEHNGQTAKQRALTASRVATYKVRRQERSNGLANAPSVTTALATEEKEKIREEAEKPPIVPLSGGRVNGLGANGHLPVKTDLQKRAERLFRRREATPWDKATQKAWATSQATIAEATPEDWEILEWYYAQPESQDRPTYRRRDLATLLNNWSAEIDRARDFKARFGPKVYHKDFFKGTEFEGKANCL